MAGGGIGAPQGGFPQQSGQPQQPGFGQQPVQMPQKPGQPFQMTLPDHYQSPYANYGFDPGLQSYLDQQNYRSTFDAGVGYQYDPTNQTFTGGTMSGRYNPIPLSVMQQAAGGNRDVLSPYFQSKYPQQPQQPQMPRQPVPTPGMPTDKLRDILAGLPQTQPQVMPQQPVPMPGQVRPPNMPFYANPNPGTYGSVNNNGVTAQTPMPQRPGTNVMPQPQPPQQRGLGGLQMNKFRNRLG